jgi:hypothetical protein
MKPTGRERGSAVVWAAVEAVERADRAYEAEQRALVPRGPAKRVRRAAPTVPVGIMTADYDSASDSASSSVVEKSEVPPGVCVVHVSPTMLDLLRPYLKEAA